MIEDIANSSNVFSGGELLLVEAADDSGPFDKNATNCA